jgi:L-methionine (R)-S-oxide reductase
MLDRYDPSMAEARIVADGSLALAELTERLRRLALDDGPRRQRAVRIAALIREAGGYRWLGLYDVLGDEIAVVGWDGPEAPTFPRFRRSRGLNGAAVRSGEPVVAQDVASDPRYLTALGTTRAEAIMPVQSPRSGEVVGTIDVESDRVNAFTHRDLDLLARCAEALTPFWVRSRDA